MTLFCAVHVLLRSLDFRHRKVTFVLISVVAVCTFLRPAPDRFVVVSCVRKTHISFPPCVDTRVCTRIRQL